MEKILNELKVYSKSIEALIKVNNDIKCWLSKTENYTKYNNHYFYDYLELLNEDEFYSHLYMNYVLTVVLKETKISMYDAYMNPNYPKESFDYSKIAVEEFKNVFYPFVKDNEFMNIASDNENNFKIVSQSYKWLKKADINIIDVKDVIFSDAKPILINYFFKFKNRNEMIDYAKRTPENFIAYCYYSNDREQKGKDEFYIPTHTYFIAKYKGSIFLIKQHKESDKDGLLNVSKVSETISPFTDNVGSLWALNKVFKETPLESNQKNLPNIFKNYEEIKAIPLLELDSEKQLFLFFAKERIIKILDNKSFKDTEKLTNMGNNTLLLTNSINDDMFNSEPICEAEISKYFYNMYEKKVQSSSLVVRNLDYFSTQKSQSLMIQLEKERIIKEMIFDDMGFSKDSSFTSRGGRESNGDFLRKKMIKKIPFILDLFGDLKENQKKLIKTLDVCNQIEVYKKNKKQYLNIDSCFNQKFVNYSNTNEFLRIGLFEKLQVKKGFGKFNSYDENRTHDWVNCENADYVVSIVISNVFELIEIFGEEIEDKLPLELKMMFKEYDRNNGFNCGNQIGVKKSHFKLRSPIDELFELISESSHGIKLYFTINDVLIVETILEKIKSKLENKIFKSHIYKDKILTELPLYVLNKELDYTNYLGNYDEKYITTTTPIFIQ